MDDVDSWTGSVIRPGRADALRCESFTLSEETATVVFVAGGGGAPPLATGEGSFVLSWRDAQFAAGKLERPEISIDRIKASVTFDRSTLRLSFSTNATDLGDVLKRRGVMVPSDFEKEI